MDNNFNIDLCVMDAILTIRALKREHTTIINQLRYFCFECEQQYVLNKRLMRLENLLLKYEQAVSRLPYEEQINNYEDDMSSI